MTSGSVPAVIHLFDRNTGLNVLLDEARLDPSSWPVASRQVSVALLNLCDLQCSYCYAPKHKAALSTEQVLSWLPERNHAGCIGVGFGGGEPTLHPRFVEICQEAAGRTQLAITFTTHGHRLSAELLDRLQGTVHFVRVSVDGVGSTYEAQRGRPYARLVQSLERLTVRMPLGINVVVNQHTVRERDALAQLTQTFGARELLLLPQQATATATAAVRKTAAQKRPAEVRVLWAPITTAVAAPLARNSREVKGPPKARRHQESACAKRRHACPCRAPTRSASCCRTIGAEGLS